MFHIKVSVVIPVYNTEKYLIECLESVRNQTLKEIEIICVDDGSDDNSLEILNEYAEQDKRFVILSKEHQDGTGAAPARNLGLSVAKGKYIIFLDSDDFFELNMLEETFEHAEKDNAEAVIFNVMQYDNVTKREIPAEGFIDKRYLPQKEVFSGSDVQDTLFQITWGGAWNILFLYDFIKEKNIMFQAVNYTDDISFVSIALAEAVRITVLDKYFVHYRVNLLTSQSASRYKNIKIMYAAPIRIKEEFVKRGIFEKYKNSYLNRFLPHMVDFVLKQQTYSCFEECYNLLKGKVSEELSLDECLSLEEKKVYDTNTFYEYRKIMQLSPAEYLFDKKQCAAMIYDYKLPQEIYGKERKVIIYGAGNYGRRAYGQIYKDNICNVVAWVDKNYEQIGFPVEKPDTILNHTYDYIVIAITNSDVIEQVENYLFEIGVDSEVILRINRNDECIYQ